MSHNTHPAEIGSVHSAKADWLELYSDAHKDVYGVRSMPNWTDPDYTLEDAMGEMLDIIDLCNKEAAREHRQEIKSQGENHIHWLMLQEASRHTNGLVYKNPNWEEGWDMARGPYGKNWYGDREYEYYLPKMFSNNQLSELGRLI